MEDKHSQAFRARSTEQVLWIPTKTDPKTKKPIILWSDIKLVFEAAKSVWNDSTLVPFLIDENTLEP